jgi:hypothetical protein
MEERKKIFTEQQNEIQILSAKNVKLDGMIEKKTNIIIKQQNEIQILSAKNVNQEGTIKDLVFQVHTDLIPRLKQYEELYYSRVNHDL